MMSQKFPHLNITHFPGSAASPGTSKPLLTVKSNSQLLKPGVSGASKSQSNIAGLGKANVGNTKTPNTNTAAKSKLALFKAQVIHGVGLIRILFENIFR